jgi:hypothetical protein
MSDYTVAQEVSPKDFIAGNIPVGSVITWRTRGDEDFVFPAVRVAGGWTVGDEALSHKELVDWLAETLLMEGLSVTPYLTGTGPYPLEFVSLKKK